MPRPAGRLTGVTPHSLRASCASWVAETDGVLEAAQQLGHARSSITTRHYARPMAGGDTTVADRLDQARQAARAAASGTDMARVWHDGQIGPSATKEGEATPRLTRHNARTGR